MTGRPIGSSSGIKIFRLKSDFKLFSNSQDHSRDQCKSAEKKVYLGGGGVKEIAGGLGTSDFRKC